MYPALGTGAPATRIMYGSRGWVVCRFFSTAPSGNRPIRRSSKKLGAFDCSPKYILPNSGSVVGTPLNAQGYATQFATSSVMKPQT